jgi:predicted lipoprotein with Yx(FWY)xxD motif
MGTWRRRVLIPGALGGAALLAVSAVACGGGSGSAYGGSSSPTAKAAATSAAVGTATGGDSSLGSAYGTPASGGGAASSASIGVGSTSLGSVLVDGAKMTLYVFAKDTAGSGKSACSGACATNWPPLTVTSVPAKPAGANGALATITRDDGTMQLTYNGMPLYRFAADKAPGDTKGEGVAGVWTVAKP